MTIPYASVPTGNSRVYIAQWTDLANGDAGDALRFCQYADKSVQVAGTFGAGGSLRLEGSNDGTNWHALTDPQGNALNFTAAGIEAVTEATFYVRPRVTAGDGTTLLTATLLMKE